MKHAVDILLEGEAPAASAEIMVRGPGFEIHTPLGALPAGSSSQRIYLPDLRRPAKLEFTLLLEEVVQHRQTVEWQPARHWTVFLVHSSHHDLGYTDLPGSVLREHAGFLDQVLDFCDETDRFPQEARFHYLVEQAWSLLHWIDHRPPDQVERMARRLREGRVEVTALYGNAISELCSHEELIRLLYPAFQIKRQLGAPLRTAELNDIPGLAWGLATALAGAGIRYFAPGLPDYFAWGGKVRPYWDESAVLPRNQKGAFWWQGPDGSRVLFWYEGGYIGLTCDQVERELPGLLERWGQDGYPYENVRVKVLSGHRDNSPPDLRLSLFARQWNARWAYPRLVFSNNAAFFKAFEKEAEEAGPALRVLRGDFPGTDYPIGAASTARATGLYRRAQGLLSVAERWATASQISHRLRPSPFEGRAAAAPAFPISRPALEEGWESLLLYNEHTWGMAYPIGPAQEVCRSLKGLYAARALALAHDLLEKAINFTADRFRLEEAGPHLAVFNPLSQPVTACVQAAAAPLQPCSRPMHWRTGEGEEPEIPILSSGTALGRNLLSLPVEYLDGCFELLDLATGSSVPYQVVITRDPAAARPEAAGRSAMAHTDPASATPLNYSPAEAAALAFVAGGIPSCGYKTYRLRRTPHPPTFAQALQVSAAGLENRFYRIELDPETGAITSLYDKELGREWVDPEAPHGFHQIVARFSGSGETVAPEILAIKPGEAGPVFASLIVEGRVPGCPSFTQEITLYQDLKQIDFATRLLRDAAPNLEHALAFPFKIERPSFRLEIGTAAFEPVRDQLPGSNTAVYAVQDWVSAGDEAGEVLWSSLEAPLVALGGFWTLPVSQAHHGETPAGYGQAFLRDPARFQKGTLYSLLAVSNFRTNFMPTQPGEMLFRYRLTSRTAGGSASAGRLACRTLRTPLAAAWIAGPQDGPLESCGSFCQVDPPNALLTAFKPGEQGEGLILRLLETEGKETRARVTLPWLEIARAFATNLVEENEGLLPSSSHQVWVDLKPYGFATVRCLTKG